MVIGWLRQRNLTTKEVSLGKCSYRLLISSISREILPTNRSIKSQNVTVMLLAIEGKKKQNMCLSSLTACSTKIYSLRRGYEGIPQLPTFSFAATGKPFFFFFFLSSGGWGKIKSFSSPHFRVFSYASCVDLTQLLSQPNASWRTLRVPL